MSEIPKLPRTSAVMVPMSGWANGKTIAKVERELSAWHPTDACLVTITFTDGSTWHLSACSCCGGVGTDDVEDSVETQQMVDALIEARAVGKEPEEVLHQLVNATTSDGDNGVRFLRCCVCEDVFIGSDGSDEHEPRCDRCALADPEED